MRFPPPRDSKPCQALFTEAEKNLQKPVKLYAQLAIQSARNIDPLFKESTAPLTKDLSDGERTDFDKSRDGALAAIHGFADSLEKKLPQMVDFAPMGEVNYDYYLKHVLLLPLERGSSRNAGVAQNSRVIALSKRLLPDPSMADPNPARGARIFRPIKQSFLQSV